MDLVSCAFWHHHKVDATVGLFLILFLRGLAGPGGNARSIDALLDNVFLGQIGSGLRQLGGLWLLAIGVTDDYQFGAGIVLQTQRHVIANALAGIVESRRASFVVAAIAGLGRLWWRRRLLHIYAGGRIGSTAAAVADRAFYRVATRSQSGRVKLRLRTIAGHLAPSRRVTVGQRIAIGIARGCDDSGALTRHNRAAFGSTRDRRRLIWFLAHSDVCR